MKILMLTSGDRAPATRFRMYPFAECLRRSGHRCRIADSFPQKYDWIPWIGFRPSQLLKRFVRILHYVQSRILRDEIVIIEREVFDHPSAFIEEWFRKSAKRIVLDLDDGVFLRYPEKFEQLAAMADLIICGNAELEAWAKERNEKTLLIPTCVELAAYPEKDWSVATGRPVRIGWIGTTGNLKYLAVAAPALRKLAETHEFEFRVIVPDPSPLQDLDLTGVNVHPVEWDKRHEVDQLREIDIGLMPLFLTDEWDKYKCGLKLIQYMAVGMPAVASPVGVNATIVTHGTDGFLAATDDEWFESLQCLIESEELRRNLGAAGRVTAAEKYSVEANYPRYESELRRLLE
ncbi:MAG TPA: glycosyltransferase family 4 protein [Planctomycetaceae bacterium]|nr:glycosyltransferase family 4 protein [Planctomycetaceae bacterium]